MAIWCRIVKITIRDTSIFPPVGYMEGNAIRNNKRPTHCLPDATQIRENKLSNRTEAAA